MCVYVCVKPKTLFETLFLWDERTSVFLSQTELSQMTFFCLPAFSPPAAAFFSSQIVFY